MAPLVFFTILLGIYPSLATDLFGTTVATLLEGVHTAQAAVTDVAQNTH